MCKKGEEHTKKETQRAHARESETGGNENKNNEWDNSTDDNDEKNYFD